MSFVTDTRLRSAGMPRLTTSLHAVDWGSTRTLELGVGSVECAEPLILDVAGRVVLDEALCKPDKCAVPPAISLGRDTCGGEDGGLLSRHRTPMAARSHPVR